MDSYDHGEDAESDAIIDTTTPFLSDTDMFKESSTSRFRVFELA